MRLKSPSKHTEYAFFVKAEAFLWLALSTLWLGLAWTPILAAADQPKAVEYLVRCDKTSKQLTSVESGFPDAVDTAAHQQAITEFVVKPDAITKIGGTDMQPLRLPAARKVYQCRLGKALYRVVIEPYIFNARVMGECGAAEPVISVSMHRNDKRVFSNVNFAHCHTGRIIHRLQISEATQSIHVLALLDAVFLPLRIARTFSAAAFPRDWEQAIFDDFPTGDVNADLFLAIHKRDIALVQQVLRKGADASGCRV